MKILSLSGFVPEQICDTVRFLGYQGDAVIPHYCGYVADYIAQVKDDDSIDGAVFPRSCDSCRIIGSYLSGTSKFTYQIPIPARQDETATEYLAEEIKAYQAAVEAHYGIRLEDIPNRILRVNERNEGIRNLYGMLGDIRYGEYLRRIHKMLSLPLFEQELPEELGESQNAAGGGKRIYLVGSTFCSEDILEIMENCGLVVVGDNLPESGRLACAPSCETAGDVYRNIARNILSRRLSPTQNNFKRILEYDLAEIKKKGVRGVIFLAQKYCEPYDYLYSVYERRLASEKIPILKISFQNSLDRRKSELALGAFSDII